MTLLAWLQSRAPAPPAALVARILAALGSRADEDASRASALCLEAAAERLEQLLAQDPIARDSAFDLLAVDALVTYAFEAAASNIDQLDERARSAMLQLGALAGSHSDA